ncbi:hypothetical protein GWI33_022171 [Rhynchophorus ferrugineus]|uniref:Uncharacterized protein n=1 Tax=Rhynchophorus ferrugineus TaxID=354439 RepID=A0A834MMP3_RHYFE|nr:hypothetical protein GWI33_022171 [Rhynchophorus ferrugineus]
MAIAMDPAGLQGRSKLGDRKNGAAGDGGVAICRRHAQLHRSPGPEPMGSLTSESCSSSSFLHPSLLVLLLHHDLLTDDLDSAESAAA